jgi:hypothetical protein
MAARGAVGLGRGLRGLPVRSWRRDLPATLPRHVRCGSIAHNWRARYITLWKIEPVVRLPCCAERSVGQDRVRGVHLAIHQNFGKFALNVDIENFLCPVQTEEHLLNRLNIVWSALQCCKEIVAAPKRSELLHHSQPMLLRQDENRFGLSILHRYFSHSQLCDAPNPIPRKVG